MESFLASFPVFCLFVFSFDFAPFSVLFVFITKSVICVLSGLSAEGGGGGGWNGFERVRKEVCISERT